MTLARVFEPRPRTAAGQPELATFGYHDVTDNASSSGFQRPAAMPYKLTRAAFAQQLDAIGAVGTPRLVTDVNLALPGRHHLLTFDDGGHSAVATADELLRRGWRGHFFLITRLIGTRRFLSVSEVRYLHSCGHVVGSHSHTHPDIFRDQPRSRMDEEWRVSSDILAQLLGEPCLTASVPGGDLSSIVMESAADAGLRYLFTSEPWVSPRWVRGCWMIGRVCPTAAMPLEQVAALARFRGWRGALFVRRLKEMARASLPSLYRQYVRVRTREFGEARTGPGVGGGGD
jgi:peptidoglycan/xylan/chitin deacetylase (PgdA/CDA1 family)